MEICAGPALVVGVAVDVWSTGPSGGSTSPLAENRVGVGVLVGGGARMMSWPRGGCSPTRRLPVDAPLFVTPGLEVGRWHPYGHDRTIVTEVNGKRNPLTGLEWREPITDAIQMNVNGLGLARNVVRTQRQGVIARAAAHAFDNSVKLYFAAKRY